MRNLAFIFLISLFSCNNYDLKTENNKYQIVSILFNELAKPIEPFFPPMYPGKSFTLQDSIAIKLQIERSKNELKKKKFIIAVVPVFNNFLLKKNKQNLKFVEYNNLLSELGSIKTEEFLDIKKINSTRNDSIITFNENLLSINSNEYNKFDYSLHFVKLVLPLY